MNKKNKKATFTEGGFFYEYWMIPAKAFLRNMWGEAGEVIL
jgi:hypothetical protein